VIIIRFKSPEGVAASLLSHAPTWFQRRYYTVMIQNADANIPDDWLIQIFYTQDGQSLKGLEINRGIQRLVSIGRVILTEIPAHVLKVKKRKYELMTEKWIWENMLAEKVLLFGGNSVICSNSPHKITDFLHYDYIGAPWNAYKGQGGDGGISLRSKSIMLAVIDYELEKHTTNEAKQEAYKHWGQEDHFFVSRLVEMTKKKIPSIQNVRISTYNESAKFAGVGGVYNLDIWAVSGTLPDIPFEARDKFQQFCPEIKIFYPSLHDPSCFGASPDGEKCRLSICALEPREQRKGGFRSIHVCSEVGRGVKNIFFWYCDLILIHIDQYI
jgi:hypothetical protein